MQLNSTPYFTTGLAAALCAVSLFASYDVAARPKLESTCGGGIPIAFVRACDAHADKGYVPLRRQLSDGSCMNMCCQQDANGNISCVNDPNAIVGRTGVLPQSTLPQSFGTQPSKSSATTVPRVPGVLPNSK